MTADENVMSAGESSVGAWLRSAREAAGLSEDAVAQQLKLAPRQVRAIEEDDYARLPGRTFVRGLVRNYARLVHLDADALLASLPDAAASPSLIAHQSTSMMYATGYLKISGSSSAIALISSMWGLR